MCLITFAYKSHPKYSLVLVANRDEFYTRPTRNAQYWIEEGYPDILAGKDLEASGTWMGIHKNRKWAALTNYRDLNQLKENPPSRGDLALNFLKSDQSARQYLKDIQKKSSLYNGFNLLLNDEEGIFHFSNQTNKIIEVTSGIHGLSNALLDTPWPKLELAKSGLNEFLKQDRIDTNELFDILKNETKAEDDKLPKTGLSFDLEKAISSVFIKTDGYGTRCSTLLLIHTDGTVEFIERRYNPTQREVLDEQHFKF